MGGGIAQLVALDYPDRVASLVLMSTSPGGPGARQSRPPADVRRAAVIEYVVNAERPLPVHGPSTRRPYATSPAA
jgi:pimeloyl-ACP methyl ester carboxylesterase